MELFRKFEKYNKLFNLIEENDKIIVGFSGGPDSVFLTEMLFKLKEKINFSISLVHLNHMFRGEDADADENFCIDYAKKNNVEVFSRRINIIEIAEKEKKTFEEVGRNERYKLYNEVLEKISANKIATAHNKDDLVETFLFRLIRGTSLEGLTGIKNKHFNIVRPILDIYKEEILKYLNENKIEYRIDKTNFENKYTRNSIRLDLIPFIEKRYNPKFKDKIFNLIQELNKNNLENRKTFKNLVNEDNKIILENFLKEDLYTQEKFLVKFLNEKKISVNRNKISEIIQILYKNGSKEIDLDSKYKFVKDYKFLFLEPKTKKIENDVEKEKKIKIPGKTHFNNYVIKAKILEDDYLHDKNDVNSFLVDIDNFLSLSIRFREDGDKIFSNGMNKKIKKIMIDKKIPKNKRDTIPILCYNNKAVWIIGIEKGSVQLSNNKSTKKVLFQMKEVQIEGK